jgi:hypothetical protein
MEIVVKGSWDGLCTVCRGFCVHGTGVTSLWTSSDGYLTKDQAQIQTCGYPLPSQVIA